MDYLKNLEIDPTAHIAPSATVIGDVIVGAECTILQGATIRGDFGGRIEIGKQTNVQENCCIHVNHDEVTRIGDRVTIGHGAIVHGCEIGEGSLIGMGAVVIDRAKIGSHCLVGAGALVTGTANIPDRSLVIGSPARAVRPLTEKELAELESAWKEYCEIGTDMERQGLLLPGSASAPCRAPQLSNRNERGIASAASTRD